MLTRHTRREFFRRASAVGVGAWIATGVPAWGENRSANEKLNVGVIGANGRGKANLDAVGETENIVALCDVDELRLSESAAKRREERLAACPGAPVGCGHRHLVDIELLEEVLRARPAPEGLGQRSVRATGARRGRSVAAPRRCPRTAP